MAQLYTRKPGNVSASDTRFSDAPLGEVEHSFVASSPTVYNTFNAGDIVPIFTKEMLPGESLKARVDFVIRQTTLLTPTMGNMDVCIVAYFVPNRIINDSWANVMGENTSGSWVAPVVDLAPLYNYSSAATTVKIPVDSVADYYEIPTQAPIPASVLVAMNENRFRGYLAIYNEYWRDENYQAPIPFSRLNVCNNFLGYNGDTHTLGMAGFTVEPYDAADGGIIEGSFVKAVYGEGGTNTNSVNVPSQKSASAWSALDPPLKANKLHDYFTSVLPSPQKGDSVVFSLGDKAPLAGKHLRFSAANGSNVSFETGVYVAGSGNNFLNLGQSTTSDSPYFSAVQYGSTSGSNVGTVQSIDFQGEFVGTLDPSTTDVYADLSQVSGISLSELRDGAAIQQIYEQLARSGSRYLEFVSGFFGISADNPYQDIPIRLGKIHRSLDLYQTAQTSATQEGDTPQGNLAAFGYTSNGGDLFHYTALEHGTLHVLACVRHKNIYPAFIPRSMFRRSMLDFYFPQLANISEQPVYTREINCFVEDKALPGEYKPKIFGYQEAWADYRYNPDRVAGYMRPGVSGSLDVWNYADVFDENLAIADGTWIQSNSQEVLDRTLAVTSSNTPQFKGQFKFTLEDELPMPVYSVPGLDIL